MEVLSLKTEAANQYLEGFEKALAQAQFLYPRLVFNSMGPFIVIKGDQLKDDVDEYEQTDKDDGTNPND